MKQPEGLIFNILALLISFGATMISTVVLVSILLRRQWLVHNDILLATNAFIALLTTSTILLSLNIHTFLGEIHVDSYPDSTVCRVRGYLFLFGCIWLFYTFGLQAFGRMLNIIYWKHLILRSVLFTKILIIVVPVILMLMISLSFLFNAVAYVPEDFYCITDFRMWNNYTYLLSIGYVIPIALVVISYTRVIIFLRQASISNHGRQRSIARDVLVLQRLAFIVASLFIFGVPTLAFWFQWIFTKDLNEFAYRIQVLMLAFNMLVLSIALVLINPQLKSSIIFCRRNRIAPAALMNPWNSTCPTV
jgi:hypothetical protein